MRALLFFLSTCIFVAILCSSFTPPSKKKNTYWVDIRETPGITFLDEMNGMDQTEATNFHWLEYLYWLGRTYGKQSPEYIAALPDTTGWMELDSTYYLNVDNYLRHPSLRDYPVVGVSYEQAEKYAEWRSNMVFQYFLVKTDRIEWERTMTEDPDSIITIERYKAGTIPGISRDPSVNIFPNYHIPSRQEWERSIKHNAEAYVTVSKRQLHLFKKYEDYERTTDWIFPRPVVSIKVRERYQWYYFLQRNVSEWVNDGKTTVGENWLNNTTFNENPGWNETDKPAITVGFRCAFTWVQ